MILADSMTIAARALNHEGEKHDSIINFNYKISTVYTNASAINISQPTLTYDFKYTMTRTVAN